MRYRRDGFTPERKLKALAALQRRGSIADACRAARITRPTFYRHEKKDPEFAEACRLARAQAARPLEALAWKRAVEGVETRKYRNGELVEVIVKPSDAMLRLLLQATNPGKYAPGPAKQREALEKELREKIKLEREDPAVRRKRARELRAKILQRLSEINRQMGGDG